MHNSKFPHLAVFARESHKRAKEVAFKSEAYDINMPARAPIWTGLKENEERIGGQISKAIDKTWKGKE